MDLQAVREMFDNETTPLIRTDFSSDERWARIATGGGAWTDPGDQDEDEDEDEDDYRPNIDAVSDPGNDGLTPSAVVDAWRGETESGGYVILADARSMKESAEGGDPTVCYVDLMSDRDGPDELGDVYGRQFRCVLSEVAAVEANLSLSNVDFAELADHADQHHGVYPGLAD